MNFTGRCKTEHICALLSVLAASHNSSGIMQVLEGWERHVDPESQQVFWHNPTTGDTTWDNPANNAQEIYQCVDLLDPGLHFPPYPTPNYN